MKIIYYITLISSLTLFSCGIKKSEQNNRKYNESVSNTDLERSALNFAKSIFKENLRVTTHKRVRMGYLDVQMIFEADDFESDHFNSYTSYSNMLHPDNSEESNYEGYILFVATYKDVNSAEHAFQELKYNTQIRIDELKGMAGLLIEQVQIFERIRISGGMFTQKDKYIFYLLKNCGIPPVEKSWSDYQNLFLTFIAAKNEKIEIINADCGKDQFLVQEIKVSW